jgi:hypothetical protein
VQVGRYEGNQKLSRFGTGDFTTEARRTRIGTKSKATADCAEERGWHVCFWAKPPLKVRLNEVPDFRKGIGCLVTGALIQIGVGGIITGS